MEGQLLSLTDFTHYGHMLPPAILVPVFFLKEGSWVIEASEVLCGEALLRLEKAWFFFNFCSSPRGSGTWPCAHQAAFEMRSRKLGGLGLVWSRVHLPRLCNLEFDIAVVQTTAKGGGS